MLSSLSKNKLAIIATLEKEDVADMNFNDNEWFVLEFVAAWGEVITKTINLLQSDKTSTIDLIFVQIQMLKFEAEDLEKSKVIRNQVNAHEFVNFKKSMGLYFEKRIK